MLHHTFVRPIALAAWLLLPLLALSGPTALAHGEQAHGDKRASGASLDMMDTAFGRTGDPKNVTRTIEVTMSDDMRFVPDRIEVRRGETVRLRVANRGRVMHELVIGTDQELAQHAALMRKNPDMEHDAPYMAHVAPAKRGEIVWQFTRPGQFSFACLVPGHFEAGMRGTIVVKP
jgi:uncharacterized cupredoxin-like copper-binding protein